MTLMAHAAAGVVAAYMIQRATHQPFHLGIAGLAVFLSGLPDLDLLWGWWRRRRAGEEGHNPHHALWTHTPLFWVIWGGILAWGFHLPLGLVIGLALVHLVLDSIGTDDGIMWLWPWRRRQYALWPRNLHAAGARGLAFYRRYYRQPLLLLIELSLLTVASMILGWEILRTF
ncbi:MAG: metal-dependent hydrolase [Thermoflexus sp.]|uniref:metal-dependent hydrolase n=1 Tax=Thermoflexus sp. TaxID=1969742 RepID=UPI0025F32C69|nr:metal-dependent hydrolase [Thermoflexus sp.]MCS6962499.1 metal-dependent hydrolase [Thermoflexus sp.]MDW8183667.1 metal-dependent hydrolase [Anaerolineae bacterium]